MQEFQTGQPAQIAHQAILASIKTMEKAKQHAVLWFADIKKRKLYRDLGYSSMNMYATSALGFSSSRASVYAQLADKLDHLPRLRGALEKGEIGYTKANQVARVSTKENEKQWLAEARKSSRRELDRKIKQATQKATSRKKGQPSLLPPKEEVRQPAAVMPVRLNIEFTPEQFARYEALQEKIRKSGCKLPADRAEAMLELLGSYLQCEQTEQPDSLNQNRTSRNSRRRDSTRTQDRPATPPFQIHLHQCPDCARTAVQTSRGELTVGAATAERAACDAQLARPGERNKAAIPPRTRREVLSRDRHRCRRPGCTSTRYLEVHHITPRSRGGGNEAANLVTLCAGCHQLVHEKKWDPVEMVRERSPVYGDMVLVQGPGTVTVSGTWPGNRQAMSVLLAMALRRTARSPRNGRRQGNRFPAYHTPVIPDCLLNARRKSRSRASPAPRRKSSTWDCP
jgi:hypothetical protein